MSTAALEVLATRLAHELDVHDWGTPETRRHALLSTVRAFIEQHLGDPRLAPAMIATAHHISLRSLAPALSTTRSLTIARLGSGSGAWSARRRDLSDLRRWLPAWSRPSLQVGASSAGDFSRAFRAVHWIAPGGVPPCLRAS